MNEPFPLIRYTGLSAYVEASARGAYSYPVLSLFGAKTSVQAIAAALANRNSDVTLAENGETREVYLATGDYRLFAKTLPCGAHQVLVINTGALLKHCAPPCFYLISRGGEEQLQSRYFSYLDRLVPVPILPSWAGWLWRRAQEKGEIEALDGYRLTAYECQVDPEALKEDLSQALRNKELRLEVRNHETGRKSQGGILPHAAIGR